MKSLLNYSKKSTFEFLKNNNGLRMFSILKNKDQKGESDKSYSGTDSKHGLGSDRVLDDRERKTMTTPVDDKNVHERMKIVHPTASSSQNKATDNLKEDQIKKEEKHHTENKTLPEKQDSY